MERKELLKEGTARGTGMFIIYKEEDFFPFEKIYLEKIHSPFLRMNFMNLNAESRAYYDTTNFLTIQNHMQICAAEGQINRENQRFDRKKDIHLEWISALRAVFQSVDRASEYLLSFDRYMLNLNTIYVKSTTKQVKIAYLPDRNRMCGNDKIIAFLDEIETAYGDMGISLIIRKLKTLIEKENPSFAGIAQYLGQQQREHVIAYGYAPSEVQRGVDDSFSSTKRTALPGFNEI